MLKRRSPEQGPKSWDHNLAAVSVPRRNKRNARAEAAHQARQMREDDRHPADGFPRCDGGSNIFMAGEGVVDSDHCKRSAPYGPVDEQDDACPLQCRAHRFWGCPMVMIAEDGDDAHRRTQPRQGLLEAGRPCNHPRLAVTRDENRRQ